MPLTETDVYLDTFGGKNALAKDQDGNPVTVSTTSDAIQDYGWPSIWDAASTKYDKGDVDSSGQQPIVRVTTTDLESHSANRS